MKTLPTHALIRKLRINRGISQSYLAFELNISQTYYSRIEKGIIEIKVNQLKTIARALSVDPLILLNSVNQENEEEEMVLYTLNDKIKFLEGCISDLMEDRNYLREQNIRLTQIIYEKQFRGVFKMQ